MMDLSFADGFGLVQLVVLTVLAYVLANPVRGLLSAMQARNEHSLLAQAARAAVSMVEQVMSEATGENKLALAQAELEEMAARYGVELTEAQSIVLIEAAVNNLRSWTLDEVEIEAQVETQVEG